MKNINIKSILSIAVLSMGLLAACRDDSVIVYDPIKNGVLGFYAKMIAQPADEVTVAAARATATYPFTPEVVGGNEDEIASFEISAELQADDATILKARKLVATVTAFPVDGTSKRPRGTITVSASQLNTALGIASADVVAGRFIVFHTKLNMKTRGFVDETNVNPNLAGSAYDAPFFHYVKIVP